MKLRLMSCWKILSVQLKLNAGLQVDNVLYVGHPALLHVGHPALLHSDIHGFMTACTQVDLCKQAFE